MGVYDRQIALALRLITKYGQLCTWSKPVAGVGGAPGMPVANGNPILVTGVPILFLANKTEGLSTMLSMFVGTEVPTGGVKALMPHTSFVPALVDSVIRGSEELGLLDKNGVEVLNLNGEPILYYLRFTR